MAGLIVGLVPALFAVIGLIIGIIKGFVKVQTWAGEYAVSALLTIAVGAILNAAGAPPVAAGIIVIILAVVLMFVCMILSKVFKRIVRRKMERRDEEMRKYGAVGVVNRIWGGLVLAIKGFTVGMIIVVPVFMFLDLAHIGDMQAALGLSGGYWGVVKKCALDFIVIGFLNIAIRHGFSNGISSSLWSLIVFGLAIGMAFMSYNLVFNTELFNGASTALSGTVSGWFGSMQIPEGIPLTVAKWIITAGMFLLLLIMVIFVSFFTSRVLSFARLGSAFYIADGILGALIMFIVTLGVLLLVGHILNPICDLEFMQPLSGYFESSTVAKYFYQQNLLSNMGLPAFIPLRDWLT